MSNDFSHRKVERRPDRIQFDGRVLFLTEDPELIKRQFAGQDLAWDLSAPEKNPRLRDDISTDEITPSHYCFLFDEKLAEYPYVGLKCGDETPIRPGDLKQSNFVAVVSGKRRGKGSSREHSPFSELCAGVRVVIAEGIERIYKQNCHNLGLLTTTNFDCLVKIRRAEEIPLAAFMENEDEITREIIRYGGLFPFNVARMQGRVSLPAITTDSRPMNVAEKIFARHMKASAASGKITAVKPGDAGFAEIDLRFSHEAVTPMASMFFERALGPNASIQDPASVVFFRDHFVLLNQSAAAAKSKLGLIDLAQHLTSRQEQFARAQGVKLHGDLMQGGSEGICHSLMLQRYALPGQLIVGSDSHTPHSGAIGAIAFGIGTTEVFNTWFTKDIRICVPQTVKVVVHGKRQENASAKDFILAVLSTDYVRSGQAVGKIIEYAGEAIEALSVDERATLTNMAAEIGGFTGIVAPDQKVVDFLVDRRGLPRASCERMVEGLASDPNAEFSHVIEIDAGRLGPMLAAPGDPGNGRFVRDLHEQVRVNIAYGGSCTAGKNDDMDMYALVLAEALQQGKKVADGVEFYLQFGSAETREYSKAKGYLEIFEKAGVRLIGTGCGACFNCGPGASTSPDQVVISAQKRNFPGRSGPGQIYLDSHFTVAASAVAGYITEYQPQRTFVELTAAAG